MYHIANIKLLNYVDFRKVSESFYNKSKFEKWTYTKNLNFNICQIRKVFEAVANFFHLNRRLSWHSDKLTIYHIPKIKFFTYVEFRTGLRMLTFTATIPKINLVTYVVFGEVFETIDNLSN